MKKTIFSLFLLLILFSLNSSAKHEISFNRDLSIDANGKHNVFVDVGSGSLYLHGENVDNITVSAKIYSKEYSDMEDLQEAFADKMIFNLDEEGSTIVFKALNKKSWLSIKNTNIHIDLDIAVPRSMNVEIDDGSGNMKITDIDGNLEIDDSSGSTVISNIGGDLVFDDGSGNIEVSNVQGNVIIDDGSGKQKLNNIKGSVTIDDGSGEVVINQVGGDVTIDDGSGSIKIHELAGQFRLIDGGSGSVYVNGNKWIED